MSVENLDELNKSYADAAIVLEYLSIIHKLFLHRHAKVEDTWRKYQSKLLMDFSIHNEAPETVIVPKRDNLDDHFILDVLLPFEQLDIAFDELLAQVDSEVLRSHQQLSQENQFLLNRNYRIEERNKLLESQVKKLTAELEEARNASSK